MESPASNGSRCPADVDENGEAAGHRFHGAFLLKDRGVPTGARPAGGAGGGREARRGRVGGQEAGREDVYVTSNGRNVNTDGCVLPPAVPKDANTILLDLAASGSKECLSGRLEGSCVVSDHSGLNGFGEPGERSMVGLEPGDCCEGGGFASRPSRLSLESNGLPLDRVPETRGGTRRGSGGERGTEAPCSCPAEVIPGYDVKDCGSVDSNPQSPVSRDRPPYRRDCSRTPEVSGSGVEIKMTNGGVDGTECRGHGLDIGHPEKPEALSEHPSWAFKEEMKVVNGGFHISTRKTCDDHEWDYFSGDETDLYPEMDAGCRGDTPGTAGGLPPGESAPCPAHPGTRETVDLGKGPFTPESSANTSTCESPLTEPSTREEDDLSGFVPAPRPRTLRTQSNLLVSLSCDATPLSPDCGGFFLGDPGCEADFRAALEAGRRQSAPDPDPLPDPADGSEQKMMPKRFGIADFFTRSLFSRKSKEPKASTHNATGWRLFGKAMVRESIAAKEPESCRQQEQQEQDCGGEACPQRPLAAGRRKHLEFEPLSTTALILEDRPANLPAKSLEEALRHKQEYEEMVAGAKRRELKEAQKRRRQMKERHRQEESISHAMVIWNKDILPHWDTMKGTHRVRELWWQGLPPSVRGTVWSLAIGNDLNITPELYEIFLSRAREKWRSYSETSSVNDSESDCGASLADRESSLDLIKLDISRTFPSLFIFQKGGPYHDLLHSLLGAYTCYRPDIGYVQGMSFIAAVLILNLEEADAFITFANLLNKPCQMAFFRVDHDLMLKYFAAFEVFFEANLPRLFSHFQSNSLTPDLYLIDWIFTLYSKSLPLDVACRVWDVFCRDGEESLFRTGLGILCLYEDVLLQMDFIHIAQFLTRLPEDLPAHTLFTAMANTHMVSRAGRWAQVFSSLMKDGSKETDRNGSPALRS